MTTGRITGLSYGTNLLSILLHFFYCSCIPTNLSVRARYNVFMSDPQSSNVL